MYRISNCRHEIRNCAHQSGPDEHRARCSGASSLRLLWSTAFGNAPPSELMIARTVADTRIKELANERLHLFSILFDGHPISHKNLFDILHGARGEFLSRNTSDAFRDTQKLSNLLFFKGRRQCLNRNRSDTGRFT